MLNEDYTYNCPCGKRPRLVPVLDYHCEQYEGCHIKDVEICDDCQLLDTDKLLAILQAGLAGREAIND